jgi:flagella basal body P-ring formation protein FlgA
MDDRPALTFVAALRSACARLMHAAAMVALMLVTLHAPAQTVVSPEATPPSGLDGGLEQEVRQLALSSARPDVPGVRRVEVSVGQLDPRLRLAPCAHVEPYLAEGTRLWGKSRIGLRCTQGATKWNVYLPITVKVFGTGLVATNGISSGAVITAADVAPAEIDLAEDSSPAIAQPDFAVGRTLARALKPGQSLRQAHLKARQWFAAGEMVTVLAQGEGFSVASEAQALNNGVEGQMVRVRTESGRVLTGQAVGERKVELPL